MTESTTQTKSAESIVATQLDGNEWRIFRDNGRELVELSDEEAAEYREKIRKEELLKFDLRENCNAFLIDPTTERLELVKVDWNDNGSCLDSLYSFLQCHCVDCIHTFESLQAWDGENYDIDIWINDNGMWENSDAGFSVGGESYFGRGIVLAADKNGESVPLPESLRLKLFDFFVENVKIWHREN